MRASLPLIEINAICVFHPWNHQRGLKLAHGPHPPAPGPWAVALALRRKRDRLSGTTSFAQVKRRNRTNIPGKLGLTPQKNPPVHLGRTDGPGFVMGNCRGRLKRFLLLFDPPPGHFALTLTAD